MKIKGNVNSRSSTIDTNSDNHYVLTNKVLYGSTSDAATAVELTTDGATGSGSTNRIAVTPNSTMSCVVNIAVKQTGSANSKQMLRQFLITNNGGTTSIQGTVTTLGTDVTSAGLAKVTCSIAANDTDDCIRVTVNGVLATQLKYTCFIISTVVIY